MSADKKRKIEDECRVFNEEWTVKYYFTKVGNKAVCLLCRESVAVFKEYNLKGYNQTKHANFGRNFTSEERKRKCQELVNTLKKQQCFHQTVAHTRCCNRSQFYGFIQTCKRW